MAVSLDLRKAHASHVYGEVTAILTWVNDERALVLLATHRKGSPWYIVCESAAWKYDDPSYLASQCAKAAEVLDLDQTSTAWFKLATIINDGLGDLVRMPSAPPPEYVSGNFGHSILSADGKVVAEQDIRVEREGVTYG